LRHGELMGVIAPLLIRAWARLGLPAWTCKDEYLWESSQPKRQEAKWLHWHSTESLLRQQGVFEDTAWGVEQARPVGGLDYN
jgi:hypothetical protein